MFTFVLYISVVVVDVVDAGDVFGFVDGHRDFYESLSLSRLLLSPMCGPAPCFHVDACVASLASMMSSYVSAHLLTGLTAGVRVCEGRRGA